MKPLGQLQDGLWFTTAHNALVPQDPGQGSTHFSLIHAKLLGQSGFMVHSGRHVGGLPMYCGKQEQEGDPPISRHCELGPQGEGTHGLTITSFVGGGGAK